LQSPRDRHLQLLWRIQQRYQTLRLELKFGSLNLCFYRIADPNRVLDEVAEAEDRREKLTGQRHVEPLHLPYWAELWDSASALVPELQQLGISPQTRVLDLGCGMGLCGAAAAAMGASVVLADLETPALLFAQFNTQSAGSRARTRQLDWRKDHLDETFDLIVGADILYDRSQWPFLEPFWRAHLNASGRILLGEPRRASGDEFIPWIQQRNWTLTQTEQTSQADKLVRIFHLIPTT